MDAPCDMGLPCSILTSVKRIRVSDLFYAVSLSPMACMEMRRSGAQLGVKRFLNFRGASRHRSGSKVCLVSIILQTIWSVRFD